MSHSSWNLVTMLTAVAVSITSASVGADEPTRPPKKTTSITVRSADGRLEHPGIVPVYSAGHTPDGRPYYAMRFIAGRSLEQSLQEGTAADWDDHRLQRARLLRHFVDACHAVEYAHSRGVIHRDLKPANIMLGPYGETLVVDWGLAKQIDAPQPSLSPSAAHRPEPLDDGSTRMGTALGTPNYMSPEQARGDVAEIGVASDVFNLGATLYHILTGRPPYQGSDVQATVERARQHTLASPRAVRRDLPWGLHAVCVKALSATPADRYRSVAELAGDVERWLADAPLVGCGEPLFEQYDAPRSLRNQLDSLAPTRPDQLLDDPEAPDTLALLNGGVELGLAVHWGDPDWAGPIWSNEDQAKSTATISHDRPHQGDHCLRIDHHGPRRDGRRGHTEQTIPARAGGRYLLSVWARGRLQTKGDFRLRVTAQDHVFQRDLPAGSFDWREFRLPFDVPAAGPTRRWVPIRVELESRGPCHVRIDDVRVMRARPDTSP